ncbi:uncharacterized protein LOC121253165 [Juglans microcarpa x Juglans regia]|uniref:uncharacterized protein LOC121253165 n=1 Tax=Juglans microcarpa x Juglans regia TaxID=2249226 RepID=UPI001B7E8BE4|nr:uncharacterized protein LOC121253165 [Juglans microcarpa x Juglans regia]
MSHFGDDELSIESYRSIPWLIWIQLLILVLLFFLLYCFTLFVPADHHSDQTTSTAASSTYTSQLVSNETQRHRSIPKGNTTTNVTNSCLETITQVGGGIIKRSEIGTSTSRRSRRSRRSVREAEDQVTERESSSAVTPKYYHPCDYFRQATIAFFKCLGFDSTHDQNSVRRES